MKEDDDPASGSLPPTRRGLNRDFPPLFMSESEIGYRVLRTGAKRWAGIATVLEREGLPKIDSLMGGRYWPAVRAFFDARAGMGSAPLGVDGKENWADFERKLDRMGELNPPRRRKTK